MPHPLLRLEKGAIVKDWRRRVSIALVYPNTYQAGMANLGLHVMYGAFNAHPQVVCERAFLPDHEGSAPMSIESSRPLKAFDVIAISISSENDYLNALKILRSCGIPLRSQERGRRYPLIMAGGIAVTLNPAPFSPFCDAIFIGEGEEAASEIAEALVKNKSQGKGTLLDALTDIPGVLIPSFETGTRVRRRWLKGIDKHQARTLISTPMAGLGGMRLIEISRGCRWKCRFCTASFAYLPPRERSLHSLRPVLAEPLQGDAGRTSGRGGKTGLVSAMVSDHSEIQGILEALESLGQKVSVSSLRASASFRGIIEALMRSGHRTLTVAPETGSERLRKVINKHLLDRDVLDVARMASEYGIPNLKLYFLLGLPTETQEDLDAIPDLVGKIRETFMPSCSPSPLEGEGRVRGKITVALSPFVPKAWTPFQWAPYEGAASLKEKTRMAGRDLKKMKGVRVKAEGIASSAMEAYLSRADEGAADVMEKALAKGGWRSTAGADPVPEYRERGCQESFPWDIVDMGIKKEFLWKEYEYALKEKVTPPCDVERCRACGVC